MAKKKKKLSMGWGPMIKIAAIGERKDPIRRLQKKKTARKLFLK